MAAQIHTVGKMLDLKMLSRTLANGINVRCGYNDIQVQAYDRLSIGVNGESPDDTVVRT
ncbi:MAG: hypothetical protein GH143_03725, partial [Calditrichaeota bacterium]|nr:hypothetical protein [Calditrichota bacterium]